jgi:hypothetical protein
MGKKDKGKGPLMNADERGLDGPEVVDVPAAPPEFTLNARNGFDVLALVAIVSLADGMGMKAQDPERFAEMQFRLREFELYEEAHRGE